TDAAGSRIDSDIYAREFVLWNSGTVSIEPHLVRRPVSLEFPGAERILRLEIIDAIDSDVQAIRIDRSTELPLILWDHLDPGHGARFAVVYSGHPSDVHFNATI